MRFLQTMFGTVHDKTPVVEQGVTYDAVTYDIGLKSPNRGETPDTIACCPLKAVGAACPSCPRFLPPGVIHWRSGIPSGKGRNASCPSIPYEASTVGDSGYHPKFAPFSKPVHFQSVTGLPPVVLKPWHRSRHHDRPWETLAISQLPDNGPHHPGCPIGRDHHNPLRIYYPGHIRF